MYSNTFSDCITALRFIKQSEKLFHVQKASENNSIRLLIIFMEYNIAIISII